MKRILLLLFVVSSIEAYSQNMGIGLRIGDPTGITFKKYTDGNAWEINFGRTGYLYGRGWYDKNFDYWYDKQKYNYSAVRYSGYRFSTPLSLQIRYLWQKPIKDLEGLSWYFGVGPQFRFQRYHYAYYYRVPGDNTWYYEDYKSVLDLDFGIDFIIGLEYTFKDAPFSVFLDANIFLELFDRPFYPWGQGGFGVRFNF
jgi:hypothetical protein